MAQWVKVLATNTFYDLSLTPTTHMEGRRELTSENLLRSPHERHGMHLHTNTYKHVLK